MRTFNVKDRVIRYHQGVMRRGTVIEVYTSNKSHIDMVDTLYAITWDDIGLTERGYMGVGLELEPIMVPTCRIG